MGRGVTALAAPAGTDVLFLQGNLLHGPAAGQSPGDEAGHGMGGAVGAGTAQQGKDAHQTKSPQKGLLRRSLPMLVAGP